MSSMYGDGNGNQGANFFGDFQSNNAGNQQSGYILFYDRAKQPKLHDASNAPTSIDDGAVNNLHTNGNLIVAADADNDDADHESKHNTDSGSSSTGAEASENASVDSNSKVGTKETVVLSFEGAATACMFHSKMMEKTRQKRVMIPPQIFNQVCAM